jgi:hypothetical protein
MVQEIELSTCILKVQLKVFSCSLLRFLSFWLGLWVQIFLIEILDNFLKLGEVLSNQLVILKLSTHIFFHKLTEG